MKQLGKTFSPIILIAAFVITVIIYGCNCNHNDSKKAATTTDTSSMAKDTTTTDSLPPLDTSSTSRPLNIKH